MRALAAIAAGFLLMSPIGRAQQNTSTKAPTKTSSATTQPATPPPAGMECIDQLVMPEYTQSALQAHVDGSVWTWVQVTPQGMADKISTQVVSAYGNGPKLLTPPVEKALHETKFKTSCAGKTVSVVYRYELHGEATANPKVTTRKEPPNIVYIESQPESVTSARNQGAKR